VNLFYQPTFSREKPELDAAESMHVVKVLRHQPGDTLTVTNGQGFLFHCTIQSIKGKTCGLTIQQIDQQPKPTHHIHIAIAPTKSTDRTEWFVEKATELGIQTITFLNTKHGERPRINHDRMVKTAVAAIKQSGQAWLPVINPLTNLENMLRHSAQQKFIAHVGAASHSNHLLQAATKQGQYLVLIGPEGDFSVDELDAAKLAGFTAVSLGNTTLRTETAALAACHTLNLLNG
jgi:16S rRNA (uracil1498-N3)-methyltransferase